LLRLHLSYNPLPKKETLNEP